MSIVLWLDRFNIPFGTLPKKIPQLVVCGEVFKIEKCENPSEEQLNDVHKRFGEAMKDLFDKYKGEYAKMFEEVAEVKIKEGSGKEAAKFKIEAAKWRGKSLYFENEALPPTTVSASSGSKKSQ